MTEADMAAFEWARSLNDRLEPRPFGLHIRRANADISASIEREQAERNGYIT